MKRIEIIFTEDQPLFRETMIPMLEKENIFTIAEASNGKELLSLLEKGVRPEIVLLDLQMPEMDGNTVLGIVKAKYPEIKVIVLTSFTEQCLLNDFREKGVNAFLTKETKFNLIVSTIKKVSGSKSYHNFPVKINTIFTKGELKVIPLLCTGKTSKQIGELLGITAKAVEAYRKRLYQKTNSKNIVDFTNYCSKHGLEYLGISSKAA
jgi:DNA-binding NarL/FixJ family response regulator